MGMAMPRPQPRKPYRLDNGLMHCEKCPCTYSRGGWATGYDLTPRNETVLPRYRKIADLPDDVCPMCRTKEERAI